MKSLPNDASTTLLGTAGRVLAGLLIASSLAFWSPSPVGPAVNSWSCTGFALYLNQAMTMQANLLNLPVGKTYWFNSYNCPPQSTCSSSTGSPLFQAEPTTVLLNKAGPFTGPGLAVWPNGVTYDSGCACFLASIDGADSIDLPGNLLAGPRVIWEAIGSGATSTISNTLHVVLTAPNTVDIGVSLFDVKDETLICQTQTGAGVTVKYTLKNFGELTAAHLTARLYISDVPGADAAHSVLIDQRPLAPIAGGNMGTLIEYTVHLDQTDGARYFRVFVSDDVISDGATNGDGWSDWDKVNLGPDMDFIGNGLTWLSPSGAPALACYGETLKFSFVYHNKGAHESPSSTAVSVEIKTGSTGWESFASIPIGKIACHSADIPAGPFEIALITPSASDPANLNKKRKLRLNFVNAGQVVASENNDKSKGKLIKIAPVPDPKVTSRQLTAWLPAGRPWGGNPGDKGNSVDVLGEDKSTGPSRYFRFELANVSNEPGVCMNYGRYIDADYLDPDLKFLKDASTNQTFDPPTSAGLAIKTTGKSKSATAAVTCFDYGAYGMIRTQAVDDLGHDIGAASPWLVIPEDKKQAPGGSSEVFGNHISDAWQDDLGTTNDALADTEGGFGTAGDGLSKYEEYRGFIRADLQHKRFSPFLREIGIARTNSAVLGYGGFEQFITVHELLPEQMNGTVNDPPVGPPSGTINPQVGARVINFNASPLFHLCSQHGLILNVDDQSFHALPTGTVFNWGYSFKNNGDQLSPGNPQQGIPPEENGSPGMHSHCDIYAVNILDDCAGGQKDAQGTVITTFYWNVTGTWYPAMVQWAIAHELCHGVSVEHHRVEESDPTVTVDPAWTFLVTDYPYNFSGTGKTQPNSVWKLNNLMGCKWCLMRYRVSDIFASICGDTNPMNGNPHDFGEHPNETWATVTPVQGPWLCSGNSLVDTPMIGLPPGNDPTKVNDNCKSKVDVSDVVP